MSRRKETIRISLGPSANAISSHLCNLEGFACTNAQFHPKDTKSPLCDPIVTHRSIRDPSFSNNNYVHVSRTLFIDTQDGFGASPRLLSPQENHGSIKDVITWNGNIQLYEPGSKNSSNQEGGSEELPQSQKERVSSHDVTNHQSQELLHQFHQSSHILSQQTNRYNCPIDETISNQSSRHMNWDDMDEEEEEEEEEYSPYDQERKRLQQTQQKAYEIYNTHTHTSDLFQQLYQSDHIFSWYDYLLPPLPPSNPSMVSLPLFTNQSDNDSKYPSWDSFHSGYDQMDYVTRHWRNEILTERLRKLLEETDYLSGVQIMADGCGMGMYAGLNTFLLQELQEECKSVKTFSILTNDNYDVQDKDSRRNAFYEFRKSMNNALSLHGLCTNSHVTLPLHLSQCGSAMFPTSELEDARDLDASTPKESSTTRLSSSPSTLFQSTASAALALECATLPYRLSKSTSSFPIAMAGSSIVADPYATTDRMNFSEFVTALKPTNRHSILSLDGCFNVKSSDQEKDDLEELLMKGMEIYSEDNDVRMRHELNPTFPGTWMKNNTFVDFSSIVDDPTSFIGHDYFALSSSLRPPTSILLSNKTPSSKFTNSLIQGLIYRGRSPQYIRSLPDRISTCIVPSSVSYLTQFGGYWNSIWNDPFNTSHTNKNPLSWSLLSNSTKSHTKINSCTQHLSQALKGNSGKTKFQTQNWKAFYKLSVQKQELPEEEDCLEVLEYFNDLGTLYEPFDFEEEEDYFDLED